MDDDYTSTDPDVLERKAKSLRPCDVGCLTIIAENPSTSLATIKWIVDSLPWRTRSRLAQYSRAPHLLMCLSTDPLTHKDVARNPHTPSNFWMHIRKEERPTSLRVGRYFRDVCSMRVFP